MTRTIAVVGPKGGPGKTTVSRNLAGELARLGHRVLAVDLDPQSNLTAACGLDPDQPRPTVYETMLDPEENRDAAVPATAAILTVAENLSLLPASPNLDGAQRQFRDEVDQNDRLSIALDGVAGFDYIVVDCPPGLGLLLNNALWAATHVLAVIEPETDSAAGLARLQRIVAKAQRSRRGSSRLEWIGIVINKRDGRLVLHQVTIEEVRQRYDGQVLNTVIPASGAVKYARRFQQSVGEYEPGSPSAKAFRQLAAEVVERAEQA